MLVIQQITSDASQQQILILTDGTQVQLQMNYSQQQQGWFIPSLIYKNFTLQGLRICNSPNMLYQFRNEIPFGLACFSAGDREPFLLTDFSSGASTLYILTAAEVAQYTRYLSGD